MAQDKEGFIWICTETGLSRFDGTHFRNFTTADGLSDIEILKLFADSKGRVWMAPFRKSICYYYQGKIYNPSNDPLLHGISLKKNIEQFVEDKDGNILVQEENALHIITRDGQVRNYDSVNGHPIINSLAGSKSLSGHFQVQIRDTVYEIIDDRFIPKAAFANIATLSSQIVMSPGRIVGRESLFWESVLSFTTDTIFRLPFDAVNYRSNGLNFIEDSLLYSNESTGTIQYNIRTGTIKKFLPGISVSAELKDDEGNTWFSTLGHGIYRLNSDEFRSLSLQHPVHGQCAVYSIEKINDTILAGTDKDLVFCYRVPAMESSGKYRAGMGEKNRVIMIAAYKDKYMLYGTDQGLSRYQKGKIIIPRKIT